MRLTSMPRPKRAPFTAEELAQKAEQNRRNVADHKARMDGMTRLEQAAYLERKQLAPVTDPYTPSERIEAEQIRADMEALTQRATQLSRAIERRLDKEGQQNSDLRILRTRFSAMRGLRVELPPF